MPKKSEPKIAPIHTSVFAAFLDSGRRKAGTPFEIASTPVSATAPEENPLRMRKRPKVPPAPRAPSKCSSLNGTGSMSAKKTRKRPNPTIRVSIRM